MRLTLAITGTCSAGSCTNKNIPYVGENPGYCEWKTSGAPYWRVLVSDNDGGYIRGIYHADAANWVSYNKSESTPMDCEDTYSLTYLASAGSCAGSGGTGTVNP